MDKYFLIFALLVLSFTSVSCEEEDPQPDNNDEILTPENPQAKGDRLYGINMSEGQYGFETSYEKAKNARIQVLELNIPWNQIETAEGIYTDPWGVLAATSVYGNDNIKVGFSIAVINTVAWEIPDYLNGVDITSVQFVDAFNNMIDWFMENVPDHVEIPYLSIGNEVDLVLDGDAEWSDYIYFYQEAANHIHTNYPGINVGVKTTVMEGVFKDELSKVQDINQYSDLVLLNYYPQNEHFEVLSPEIVESHFEDIVSYFPQKEIWITELGYQSGSEYCNSSEAKQAEFYHHLFTAWDTHKDHIKFILINWLHDQSPATIEEWKDYYGDDPALVEYLSTLGLINYDGSEKYAWGQLKEELNTRGWQD